MNISDRGRPLRAILRALESESRAQGYPEQAVAVAAKATMRALARSDRNPGFETRARSYFAAVLRRRTALMGATTAAARLVADAVVVDLMSTGRSRSEVLEELERGWADRLPRAVLEEFRERMCA